MVSHNGRSLRRIENEGEEKEKNERIGDGRVEIWMSDRILLHVLGYLYKKSAFSARHNPDVDYKY